MNPRFYRPAQLRALAFFGLLLLALSTLGGMVWRNLQHFDYVLAYVDYSHNIQKVTVGLQQSLISHFLEEDHKPFVLNKTLGDIDILVDDKKYLSEFAKRNLADVRALLTDIDKLENKEKNAQLINALKIMNDILDHQILYREQLLKNVSFDTQKDLYIALIFFGFILAGALLFLHFRILRPLNNLSHLLERLTEENFTAIEISHLDPLLRPVFDSYNQMVKQLAELEASKRLYAESLKYEVRVATQALLEQQASLARSERLAAIGEVAAELAHEIRNPLAGIQMAFNNLRREINDESQFERVELIHSELKRLTVLLNDSLNQSKHTPENAKTFDVTVLIKDLVTLSRYQIPENIQLEFEIPKVLVVRLPESSLRQVILNLVLNSVEALDGKTGRIMIKTWAEQTNLILNVSDTGRGFPEEILTYGIRPFRTSHAKGTGLGLAMVQRFVKNMGGVIKLTNQKSQGACVMVSLPDCLIGETTDENIVNH